MTIARAQYLHNLAASELTKAHDLLLEADSIVMDVKSLFYTSGNFAVAARLKNIQSRLNDELRAVERLLAASTPAFRQ